MGTQKSFIPTNLRIGFGLDLLYEDESSLGIYSEFSKLLVPIPVAIFDSNNNFQGLDSQMLTLLMVFLFHFLMHLMDFLKN